VGTTSTNTMHICSLLCTLVLWCAVADAAAFNLTAVRERPQTAKDTEAKMDVFAFRPATSHNDIRRIRTNHAIDLLAQHNTHALFKHRNKV